MGKHFDHISDDIRGFIEKQHLFFVATAPSGLDGHVNVSPKGMDSFRVLDAHHVAYLDLTGSGNETSAHIAENGRITFMFCAFEGSPNIVRLYGRGRTILRDDAEWAGLIGLFPEHNSTRQFITAEIHHVATACGYAVPLYDFRAERETLTKYWDAKGADALPEYQLQKNSQSIDGLPTPLGQAFSTDTDSNRQSGS